MDTKLFEKFYEKLQDDESRRLFDVRCRISFEKNYANFIDGLIGMNYQWVIDSYDDFRALRGNKKIIIFGAGAEGRMTSEVLKKNGIEIYKFCDNDVNKYGRKINGIEVISVQEVLYKEIDSFVIIASSVHGKDMLEQLIYARFPRERIWYPRLGSLHATIGWQYFDCPKLLPLGKEEVFIDAGCFDMGTSKDFKKWSGGKYKRIIAFEPDPYNFERCKVNCDMENVELLQYAVWKEKTELCFACADSGSGIKENGGGGVTVQAESIDNVLRGEKATFIKMDLEGAELMALEGAAFTIKKYKPRLAICIYHNPMDIYRIPLLLMSYRDDYVFYIRHYTTCIYETVLYAI